MSDPVTFKCPSTWRLYHPEPIKSQQEQERLECRLNSVCYLRRKTVFVLKAQDLLVSRDEEHLHPRCLSCVVKGRWYTEVEWEGTCLGSVCVCVCVIHTSMCVCIHPCVHICVWVCCTSVCVVCMCMSTCVYVCVLYSHVCIFVCVCVYICVIIR